MKILNYRFLSTLFYFLILLMIALFVKDIPIQYNNLMYLTPNELISLSTMGDPATFISTALEITRDGWVTSANQWVFNLWPPGFVLLEALIIKIFGINAPVILVLQILAAGLFSVVLTLLYEFLKGYINTIVALVLPLLIFAFPVSRVFLLEPVGISLGESFSIGFFLLFILLAIRSVGENLLRYAVYSGIFLALSAYFRSYFETILLFVTIWGILFIVVILLKKLYTDEKFKTLIKVMALILFVANLSTTPWRTYHFMYQDSIKWVGTSDLMFQNQVRHSKEFVGPAGFILAGGGNVACRIDHDVCGKIGEAKKLVLKTYIHNPLKWYSTKFESIDKYWYSSIQNWTNVGGESLMVDKITNGIFLSMFILLNFLFMNSKIRKNNLYPLLIWFYASLFSSYLIIFTFAHFEVRYFYFPKIVIVFFFIILVAIYWKEKIINSSNRG